MASSASSTPSIETTIDRDWLSLTPPSALAAHGSTAKRKSIARHLHQNHCRMLFKVVGRSSDSSLCHAVLLPVLTTLRSGRQAGGYKS